jgi:hypothetical protein
MQQHEKETEADKPQRPDEAGNGDDRKHGDNGGDDKHHPKPPPDIDKGRKYA